jgi:hypothetical protein
MASRRKQLLFALVPVVLLAVCFRLGMALGAHRAVTDASLVRDALAHLDGGMFMGNYDDERMARMAEAYHDPARALAEFRSYAWAGFEVPTPFVGHAQYPGRWGSATINEAQMRSSQPLRSPKPDGVCRIFLTGGSTAWGSGAPSNETTIGGYLQTLLNEARPLPEFESYEVMTAANPAWATTHERVYIVNRLSEQEPDLVISFSGNNDVFWGERGQDVLWFRANADMHFWNLFRTILDQSEHGPLHEFLPGQAGPVDSASVSGRAAKNIRLGAYALRMKGAAYLYALQPNLFVTGKPFSPAEQGHARRFDFDAVEHEPDGHVAYHRRCYARLRADLPAIDAPDCRFVDLSTAFDGLDAGTTVFIDMYHYGDRGNEIMARALLPRVVELLGGGAR